MGSYAEQYRTFFYNLKRYGISISKDEIRQMLITVVIIAFVWSFNKWGQDEFNLIQGLTNLLIGLGFAIIALIFNQIGQRIVAVHYGYDPSYEYGLIGLMIALVVAFASRGLLIFFLPGGIRLRHLAASRLGEFRYYTNDWEWAKAGFMGPFFNVMLALVASPFKDIPIVNQFMMMNILFAVYSLLPLPGNVGLYLFYPHIYFWTFTVGFVAACSAILFFLHPLIALLAGFIMGIFAMFYHYDKIDRKLPPYFDKGH